MTKYAQVILTVNRLTDDPTWQAFFITYLLAETDAERETLNHRFWREIDRLPGGEQQKFREGFDRNLRQLGSLAAELLQSTKAVSQKPIPTGAR